jgi:hypothetical protein
VGKPVGAPPGLPRELVASSDVGLGEAGSELAVNEDKRLRNALGGIAALAPLATGQTVQRETWERHFPEVVRRLDEVPIVPLDGLTWPNHDLDPALRVSIRLIDAKDPGLPDDPTARTRFVAGDRYRLWLLANQDVLIELAETDFRGKTTLVGGKKTTLLLRANKPFLFPEDEDVIVSGDFPGKEVKESLTLYAYPRAALARSGAAYPQGRVLAGEGMTDRVLHPLYELAKEANRVSGPDPGKMVKITLTVTIRKP